MADKGLLQYKVGALMYVPALNAGIGEKIRAGSFPDVDSIAFCLEDSLNEQGVKEGEGQLAKTLAYIAGRPAAGGLPLLFVRVRGCSQFRRLPEFLGDAAKLLTGVVFPKFDLSNAAAYCAIAGKINAERDAPLYIMPILESRAVMGLDSRRSVLLGLRELLDGCKDYVLNIRVGAMDFCKSFGLRRSIGDTVYDLGVVRDVLTDVLTVFSDAYVVSAPVWEYYGGGGGGGGDMRWAVGLENELRLDVANGFVGKTVIHPSQAPLVRKWLKPARIDVEDAKAVLDWKDEKLGVARSVGGNRMNELATHRRWAQKILALSQIYGVRDG